MLEATTHLGLCSRHIQTNLCLTNLILIESAKSNKVLLKTEVTKVMTAALQLEMYAVEKCVL
jgi:hypothetical protein